MLTKLLEWFERLVGQVAELDQGDQPNVTRRGAGALGGFIAATTVWVLDNAEATEVQMIALGDLKVKLWPVLWKSPSRNNISFWSQNEDTKVKTITLNNGRKIVYRFWVNPATITFNGVTYAVSYDDNINLDIYLADFTQNEDQR